MPVKRVWIAAGILLLLALAVVGTGVRLLTDWWWFQALDLETVFWVEITTQLKLGVAAGALFWAFLYLNIFLVKRLGKRREEISVFDVIEIPQLEKIKPLIYAFLLLGTLVAAFGMGSWAAEHWALALRYLNGVSFGIGDPLFDRDVGFYVFSLDAYRFAIRFGLLTVFLTGLVVSGLYVLQRGILITQRGARLSFAPRGHLLALGGMLLLFVGVGFHLDAYDLLFSPRGVVFGAGYADVYADLPMIRAKTVAALAAAVLLVVNTVLRTWKPTLAALVLLVLAVVAGGVYPELLQRFKVAPNEIVMETPYIRHAIAFTRRAYGIEQVHEKEFPVTENLTAADLKRNDPTIKNIRLWEHGPLLRTYAQLQEIRTYYDFVDVDNDRYRVNGEYRQVMLSPRELSYQNLPSRIWINEHLTYTHGYGLTLGPVNQISPEGLPEFFIKDIPPVSSVDIQVTRPEVYYGEIGNEYVFVNTQAKEFDYPAGDENVYARYEGSGGVAVGGFLGKLAFALRFRETKILLSSDITPDSRIMYYRAVKERVRKAAPFLRFDPDPYLVIAQDGRLHWIADAYTLTDRYPYSEPIQGMGNYIRNAVKVVVDAYDGRMRFYVSDPKDPIVRTLGKIYPGVLRPLSDMPQDLRAHIRYPQALLSIQARTYATYHMTDPQVFYNKEDLWKIPERAKGGGAMEPYYTIMKLADEGAREEFILMIPFSPARKQNMIAWMAARCDDPHYGKLLVYNFPKQKLVYGPQQIENRIDQDAVISQQLTLWDQGGSKVIRGSLLVIPVEKSLLYVQPLYLTAAEGKGLPELKRVIVAYGNRIAMEEDLERSLARIFGRGIPPRVERRALESKPLEGVSIRELIRRSREAFLQARERQRQGDWAGYGEALQRLEHLLNQLQKEGQRTP